MEMQRKQNSQNNFGKIKFGRLTLFDFKTYNKATIIEILWYWLKIDIQINGAEWRVQ